MCLSCPSLPNIGATVPLSRITLNKGPVRLSSCCLRLRQWVGSETQLQPPFDPVVLLGGQHHAVVGLKAPKHGGHHQAEPAAPAEGRSKVGQQLAWRAACAYEQRKGVRLSDMLQVQACRRWPLSPTYSLLVGCTPSPATCTTFPPLIHAWPCTLSSCSAG